MTQPIHTLLPADSPEAMILAYQEPTLEACRRAGVQWRGEGVGLGRYTLEDCEKLTALVGDLHGDNATRMGAWQLVRAAYAEAGRNCPPLPDRPSRGRLVAAEAPQARSLGPTLTTRGKPAMQTSRPRFEGEIVKADSTHIFDVVSSTPVHPRAWELAGLTGPMPATLADCDTHQLAALAGLHAETPQGRVFVTRAQWCLNALVPEVA